MEIGGRIIHCPFCGTETEEASCDPVDGFTCFCCECMNHMKITANVDGETMVVKISSLNSVVHPESGPRWLNPVAIIRRGNRVLIGEIPRLKQSSPESG